MSINTNIGDDLNRGPLIGYMLLALLATTISLSLSMLTGWQLGGSLKENLVMAACGVLAVLGAHFLLALRRPTSIVKRLAGIVLWTICIAYVTKSQAGFYLLIQQQAGARRVAAIDQFSSMPEPKRNLTAILADQAKIKTELATKSLVGCIDGCFMRKAKIISLKARIDALDAEADDVTRWQTKQDRQEALEDAARDDPVTMRLAKCLGVTITQMGLVTGLLFSTIIEGLACLCWCFALQHRDSPVTQPVMQLVTTVTEEAISGNEDDPPGMSDLERKTDELVREVKAGRLKLTVTNVREYCRCAQTKAAELKRLVEAKLNMEARTC